MINLLPPKRLLDMRLARNNTVIKRYIELALISVLFLVAVVIGAYYFFNIQQENTERTVGLESQKVEQLEPVQKQAEELSATVNTISGLLSRNVKFSEMLTQIGGLMPQGSVLTGMQFSIEDTKSPLIISAQVDDEQKAAVLRNNLAASELFEKADIKSITQNEELKPTTGPSLTPTINTAPSIYKFNTVLNAYFKDGALGVKR